MKDQFNVLLRRFGARVQIVDIEDCGIEFSISGYSIFQLSFMGELRELVGHQWVCTDRSQWLHGISLGKVRNDAGELV